MSATRWFAFRRAHLIAAGVVASAVAAIPTAIDQAVEPNPVVEVSAEREAVRSPEPPVIVRLEFAPVVNAGEPVTVLQRARRVVVVIAPAEAPRAPEPTPSTSGSPCPVLPCGLGVPVP